MPPIVMKGNLCLSSCPGKKVRLNGPIRGRAAINRDLDLDFERMKKFQITTIVCCLGDEELAFLGAPWPKYAKSAKEHGIGIIRLPMVEGHCPKTIFEMREVVRKVNIEMSKGHNVLAHCRGGNVLFYSCLHSIYLIRTLTFTLLGVGRAGLLAGCWLLENSLCKDVERTVTVLRQRRSAKAIETCVQAEFLIRYAMTVNRPLDNTNQDLVVFEGPQAPCVLEAGPPSLPIIAELERFIRSSLRPDTPIQQQQQKVNNDLVKTTVSSIPAVALPATTTTNVSSPSSPTRIHNTTELLYSPRY
ncbi:MAG: hypothetical protein EXX96DRAFT_340684 [Benjaminiella poitrasii]|nr:MAG: hypothetical protein EXX96DRAFT_340684 [Benjaminiella poitrasii]